MADFLRRITRQGLPDTVWALLLRVYFLISLQLCKDDIEHLCVALLRFLFERPSSLGAGPSSSCPLISSVVRTFSLYVILFNRICILMTCNRLELVWHRSFCKILYFYAKRLKNLCC